MTGVCDETVALIKGFAPVAPVAAGEIVDTVVVVTEVVVVAVGETTLVVPAFVGATIPVTGRTTSAARSTRVIHAIPRDTDFFIREFLGSDYYYHYGFFPATSNSSSLFPIIHT
jgi:hypothetical protein